MNLAWIVLSGKTTPEQPATDLQAFARGRKRGPDFELAAECIARGITPDKALPVWERIATLRGLNGKHKHGGP